MKPDPILEEIWKVKDELARQAGYDMSRFFETLVRWESEQPHAGPVVHSAEDLQKLLAQEERKRAEPSSAALKEVPAKPKPPGTPS